MKNLSCITWLVGQLAQSVQGPDGPGIESRWRRDFPFLSRRDLGPTQPSVQFTMGMGSFPGVKSGREVMMNPYPFYCRGQERVELYLYSPYGPYGLYRASVPVQVCTLPFSFYYMVEIR